jgi:hypothetical protein
MVWIKENPRPVMTYDVDYDITPPGQRTGRSSFTHGRARQIVMEKMGKKRES